MNDNYQELLKALKSQRPILFTGAGFSHQAYDIENNKLPLGGTLAKEICNLGKFPEDDDLEYVSDNFISNKGKNELIDFLKMRFHISKVGESLKHISNMNWWKCYTTNYDSSFQIASKLNNKKISTVTPSSNISDYALSENLCIHINGSIDNLSKESLEGDFKLTTSSYASPNGFLNSSWYSYFKRDLSRCTALIFVGYSLYDIDIRRVLFENKDLSNKTYFIVSKNSKPKDLHILGKFGTVLNLGVEGLSELIVENKEMLENSYKNDLLLGVERFKPELIDSQVNENDIYNLLMHGEIKHNHLYKSHLGELGHPYFINRIAVAEIKAAVEKGANILVLSELANGKTIFVEQAKVIFDLEGLSVYEVTDSDADLISDIDLLASRQENSILILDGLLDYIDICRYICESNFSNISIIATLRTSQYKRYNDFLIQINFSEINIDFLNADEQEQLVEIFNFLGLWGGDAGKSLRRKTSIIADLYKSQISLSILEMLNSKQIKDRIEVSYKKIRKDEKLNKIAFAVSFLSILNLESTFVNISDLLNEHSIYTLNLGGNEAFSEIFKTQSLRIKPKSSIFSSYFIKNFFASSETTKYLLDISERYNSIQSKRSDYGGAIFKATLRFSFVERVLNDKNKKNTLSSYYQELKSRISWLSSDPHYWVQYAMAMMTFKEEYAKCKSYLETAKSYALSKGRDYHIDNIETQLGRLYILMSMEESDGSIIFDLFLKGHSKIISLPNNKYKFRRLDDYIRFYKVSFDKLSKKHKDNFLREVKNLIVSVNKNNGNVEDEYFRDFMVEKLKEQIVQLDLSK